MTKPVYYDAELRRYNEILRPAFGVRTGDHVLDIGCGTGLTTREAARVAGSAFGVDVSAPAIAEAHRLAEEDGLSNVSFDCVDAQVHGFPEHRFDLAISRFGTMFFSDPVAAFTNIGRALRPDGRLVMLVWQAREHNEWAPAIDAGPGPFSLADPTTATATLQAAGFADVTFTDVRQPVFYGADAEAAFAWVHGFTSTQHLAPPAAEQLLGRLRATMTAHQKDDGVWFDSSAWIVAARRHA